MPTLSFNIPEDKLIAICGGKQPTIANAKEFIGRHIINLIAEYDASQARQSNQALLDAVRQKRTVVEQEMMAILEEQQLAASEADAAARQIVL